MLATNHLPTSAPPLSLSPVAVSPVDPAPPATHFADLDAERRLLAAVLRDSAALSKLDQPLLLCDFSLLEHRCLLDACQRLRQAEALCSPQALETEFQDHPHCDALAVVRALRTLPPPSDAAFDHHRDLDDCAQQVRHAARQRRLLDWLETAPERFRDGLSFDTLRREAAEYFASVVANPPPVNATSLPVNITNPSPGNDFDGSLATFLADPLNDAEEVIPALHRGEVAELLADEAQGKTALLLQLGLSLAAGVAQSPLLETTEIERAPRRVVYVNGDAAARRLRDDIERLLPQLENQDAAKANFRLLYEGQLDGKPPLLYHEASRRRLADWLRRQRPDLIIIDGVQALDPERSKPSQRREQGSKVFANLRELAKQANCAIVVAHSTVSNGNRRRLGNALFASANTVYHFRSDHRYRDDYRLFRCVLSRWKMPEAIGLQRRESGGYEVCQLAPGNSLVPTVEEIVAYVDAHDGVHTQDLINHFSERAGPRTMASLLKEARRQERLWKDSQKSTWRLKGKGEPVNEKQYTVWFDEDGKLSEEELHHSGKRYYVMEKRKDVECRRCGTMNLYGEACRMCNFYYLQI